MSSEARREQQDRVFDDERVGDNPLGIHALVVDDDALTRRMMWVLLRRRGCTALVADGGRRALELLRNRPEVNVALIDIHLQDMDGFMVASSLRLEAPARNLHLVALTGLCQPRLRTLALHAGFDDQLTKPFDPAALFALIDERARRRVCAEQQAQDTARALDEEQLRLQSAARALGERGWTTLARRFAPMSDAMLAALSKAVRRGDTALVKRVAHGFAGAAAQLGLLSTALLAREVELGAAQKLVDELPQLLLQLEDSIAEACDRLARVSGRR